MYTQTRFIAVIALLLLTKYTTVTEAGGHWDYVHMDHWKENYDMCGTQDQSPINIMSRTLVYDQSVCQSYLDWTVNEKIHAFKVTNNGHSVVLTPSIRIDWAPNDIEIESNDQDVYGRQYTTLTTRGNSIGRLPNYFKPDFSPHTEFCLHSFHFHWGLINREGSEHLVDYDAYPLEVHFVHYACDSETLGGALAPYPDTDAVINATNHGKDVHELAVVGIFFDISAEDNPAFDVIFGDEVFDDIQYPGSYHMVDGLYLQDLIPRNVWTDGYYSYEGSLTTPPCTPIVRWHVSNARSYISRRQMDRFRAIMAAANHTSAPNFREVQYNKNKVYACMDEEVETTTKTPTTSTTEVLCKPFCEDYYCGNEVQRGWQGIAWFWCIVAVLIIFGTVGFVYCKKVRNSRHQNSEDQIKRDRVMSTSNVHDTGSHGISSNIGRDTQSHGDVAHL